ncbi:hypothetical protein NQ317_006549, partial [Molorchus minor]
TYSELLKTIKEAVNPSEIGVDVRDIKKTRNGGTTTYDKDRIPDVTAYCLTNKVVLHIKDLDEITTVQEIREAISNTISIKSDSFDVRAPRPAFAGRQNATVVLRETDAVKLTKIGRIRIGWSSCRVLERKLDRKCFRCWEYGHAKTKCSGPDREKRCLKCGQEGHRAAECKNQAHCVFCNTEGHQSGSSKCPKKRNITHDMALATANQIGAGIILVSEPNRNAIRNRNDWICYEDLDTAIKVLDRDAPTFQRGDYTSILDLTISTADISRKITNWRVLENESLSDHNYIVFDVAEAMPLTKRVKARDLGWQVRKQDRVKLQRELSEDTLTEAGTRAKDFTHALSQICDKVMPKKKTNPRGK